MRSSEIGSCTRAADSLRIKLLVRINWFESEGVDVDERCSVDVEARHGIRVLEDGERNPLSSKLAPIDVAADVFVLLG